MKRLALTLIRHAKSSREDPGLADHERPLNARGQAAAPEMARRGREAGWKPDLILTSSAVRTSETAGFFQKEFGLADRQVQTVPGLYLASASELLKMVREIPGRARDVLLVAHNPGLEEFASLLAGEPLTPFPTCAVARFTCKASSWAAAEPGDFALSLFDTPKGSARDRD